MKKILILMMVTALLSGSCRIKKAGLPKSNNLFTPVQAIK